MRYWKLLIVAISLVSVPAVAADVAAKIYRNPNCGCCDAYARYLEQNGFKVDLVDTYNAVPVHQQFGVPEHLEGCHTAVIGGYVFEGLVPVEQIKRVLNEHRPIKGLAVPGMPSGAPGMPGAKKGPISVYYIDASSTPKVFATF